jgi:hypothetical protein
VWCIQTSEPSNYVFILLPQVILTIACLVVVHIAFIYVLLRYVLQLGQFLYHIRAELDTEAL